MAETKQTAKLAVIRITGQIGLRDPVKKTLHLLNLHKKYNCCVIENNPCNQGMVKKVKDFVTWGTINAETEKELIAKRGAKTKNKEGKEEQKPFFSLHPPRGGFERKGTKVQFTQGGTLGPRGEKINALIKRML